MTASPCIIEPEERDLARDPFTVERLLPQREKFLRRVDHLVTWRSVFGAGLETWALAPSWANAVLDELMLVEHEEAVVRLLQRAQADDAIRDATVAAVVAGKGLVLKLALQQEAEVP